MDTLLLKTIIDGLLSIHDSAANAPAQEKLLAQPHRTEMEVWKWQLL